MFLVIFMFIHILAVPWHYYKQTYKFSLVGKKQRLTYEVVKNMAKDANGEPYKLYSRDIFNYAQNLFLTDKENSSSVSNYKIEYLITENTNSALYRYNDDDRAKEREPDRALTLYYWYSLVNRPNVEDNTSNFIVDNNSLLVYTNEFFNLYRKDIK